MEDSHAPHVSYIPTPPSHLSNDRLLKVTYYGGTRAKPASERSSITPEDVQEQVLANAN